jgi:CSLREA domain-containing protein
MGRTLESSWLVLALSVVLVLALPASADAANFVVTRLDDPVPGACTPGDCSLREAVIAANGTTAADSITMGGGTHELTQAVATSESPAVGDLDVTAPLTITGAGAASTTIDANGIDRVLDANVASPGIVQLTGIKITGGSQSGIENLNGTDLRLTDSAVGGNMNAGCCGGGIDSNSGGSLTLDRTTVSDNTGSNGGGIYVAIDATLTNTTISGNTATSEGGGLYNEFGTSTLTNTTIVSNTGPAGMGGGITNFDTTQLKNSIVANNAGGNCETFSAPTSLGHNLESGTDCAFTSPGDLQSTNPVLGPLANNGGQTETHALLPGSPAIDAGDNIGCPTTDQRGLARPQSLVCDIGAYEFPDVTPPGTAITLGPPGTSTDRTPTFSFSSSEPGSSFQCRVDGGAFVTCSSPFTAPALSVGRHTFEVRAVDPAGNADPTPAAFSFVVVLPPPVLGRSFNVVPLSGRVYASLPRGARLSAVATANVVAAYSSPIKGRRFVPLKDARQLPIGSFLDTRKGTARVTSASTRKGKTFSGAFAAGVFQVLQSRKNKFKGLTELRLKGSSFRSCRPARRSQAAYAALSRRTIRRPRSNARGRFRSRGRHSAATVRGTKWTVTDRCDGTLTQVTRGTVAVRDFRRRKTILVKRGKSYLAKAPRR